MIVTISREFGAGALTIARAVAERCGFRLVIDDLPARVAERLGVAQEEVEADEDTPRPFIARLANRLIGSTADVSGLPDRSLEDLTQRTRFAVEDAVREEAEIGDVVILGHAANYVLGAQLDVVRVFIHAPVLWRIDRVAEWFGYSRAHAKEEVERLDLARAAYVRDHYHAVWGEVHGYDVTIDSSRVPLSGAAEIIISAVAARYEQA